MATKVVMEALSPTMEEGRLVAWKKKEGDPVKSGETLAEVETGSPSFFFQATSRPSSIVGDSASITTFVAIAPF
jgi:Biotin-requiring enzyme